MTEQNKAYFEHLKTTFEINDEQLIEICKMNAFIIPNLTDYEQRPEGWTRSK